ncbi:MAG: NADPH-dependent FMN reductase [Haloferacaceae archaeon]
MTTRVVAIVGSLRDGSYTRTALRYALAGAADAGAEVDLLDLRSYDLPPLDPDLDDQGDAAAFTRAVRSGDTVLLGTPVYHGSYSGVLKNALDHCGFDEFEHTTVGLLAVSGGAFPVTALEHLRSVCRALDAWVLPHQAAIPRVRSAFESASVETAAGPVDRAFVDEELEERVRTLGRRGVEYANIEPDPSTFESGQNEGAD